MSYKIISTGAINNATRLIPLIAILLSSAIALVFAVSAFELKVIAPLIVTVSLSLYLIFAKTVMKHLTRDGGEASRAIHELTGFHNAVIDNAGVCMCAMNAAGEIVLWNRDAERVTGYTRDEAIHSAGKMWEWLIPDESERERMFSKINAAPVGGMSAEDELEINIRAKDGSGKTIVWSARKLVDDKGDLIATVSIGRDISEHRKVEKALRESEEQYRTLLEQSRDGILFLVKGSGVEYMNPMLRQMTGYTIDELNEQSPYIMFVPEEREVAWLLLEGNMEETGDFNLLHKNGAIIPVDIRVTLFQYRGQEMMLTIFRDVTESRKIEEALKESEERYRILLENSQDGVALFDDGTAVYLNPVFLRKTGYTFDELKDISILDVIVPEERKMAEIAFDKIHKNEEIRQREFHLLRKDGGVVPVEILANMVQYRGKQMMLSVFHDITEKRLYIEELTKAKTMAEDATKLKDKFVSLVSHDLRSPLASIMGLAKMARDMGSDNLSTKQKDVLSRISGSCEGLLEMIDQLLNISRLHSGRIRLIKKSVDAAALVSMYTASLEPLARNKGVSLIENIPKGRRVFVDTHLFGEVIQNLVSNAIKFCNRGDEIVIFIPDDNKSVVAIKDTGVGINPAIMPDLFRHEIKTSTRGTAGEKGTGLGLPYCRDIMEAHGGTLTAESEPGNGSVFYAELPEARTLILIVDDQESARNVLKDHLRELEVEIIEAENGREAFDILRDVTPNLIITDINMPEMDGFKLLENIRKNPLLNNLPVIIITSTDLMNEAEARDKVFWLGGDDFVTKPIVPQEFLPRVKRFL